MTSGQWAAEAAVFAHTITLHGPDMTAHEMEMWLERFTDAYHHDTYGSAA